MPCIGAADSPVAKTIADLKDGREAKKFFEDSMSPLVPYIRDDDFERFVKRPISRLPSFQLVKGELQP